jgi:hypothetical protein
MKVEYVGGIRKKLTAVITTAVERGVMIDHITLDAQEYAELQRFVPEGKTMHSFMGVPVRAASDILLSAHNITTLKQ